jgi:hypothetical protein
MTKISLTRFFVLLALAGPSGINTKLTNGYSWVLSKIPYIQKSERSFCSEGMGFEVRLFLKTKLYLTLSTFPRFEMKLGPNAKQNTGRWLFHAESVPAWSQYFVFLSCFDDALRRVLLLLCPTSTGRHPPPPPFHVLSISYTAPLHISISDIAAARHSPHARSPSTSDLHRRS